MRVYAVLSADAVDANVVLSAHRYPWVLASFEATGDPRESLTYMPAGLMLDSGAFTVWTQRKTVDRAALVEWARAVRAHFGPDEVRLINLDVIPGDPTTAPTHSERARAAEESAENAIAIREAGVPVIEVYHRYEPLRFLEGILDRRQPGELVAVGGLVGRAGGTRAKSEFCDTVFALLRDRCGWDNLVPVHGLGVSGDAPLARRYPWFSVDSSTWFTMRNFNLHVTRSGKFQPRNRETAPRTTVEMTRIFGGRRLLRWERQGAELTRMWEQRGVRFTADVLA